MARRRWTERDHPRHPGESPGGVGGRFRERVGSSGWAARLNSMLGGRRGATEREIPGNVGGRSDLGDDSDEQLRAGLARSDADYARGISPRERAIMDEGDSAQGRPRLSGQEVAQALAPERDRESPIGFGLDELDDAPDEPGVKLTSGQGLADRAGQVDNGDWEAYNPDFDEWTPIADVHEEDIDDDEFDDYELEEMEESGSPMYTIVISGKRSTFRVDPDEEIKIRRRRGGSR